MVGAIVMIVVLLVFPVVVLMSMAALAALLGGFTKAAVDAEHRDSVLLEMANFADYDRPPVTATDEA